MSKDVDIEKLAVELSLWFDDMPEGTNISKADFGFIVVTKTGITSHSISDTEMITVLDGVEKLKRLL